jgi:hypothetical protein
VASAGKQTVSSIDRDVTSPEEWRNRRSKYLRRVQTVVRNRSN